jgi:hypothetical protein
MADDERRAKIEAATDALLADSGLPRYGGHRATIERRMRLAFDAADRVRDARGDDEAALNSMWSIMQTQFERGRTPECPGPTRDDAHKMLAGLHRVAARSPQDEDHE